MQLRSALIIIFLAFTISACSTVSKLVYRIDVPQGNYLTADQIEQLKVGMTEEQVAYLLGTPVLSDPFNSDRWYYVFLQQKAHEDPIQHTLIVFWDSKKKVRDFTLTKDPSGAPLPASKEVNNTIINASQDE